MIFNENQIYFLLPIADPDFFVRTTKPKKPGNLAVSLLKNEFFAICGNICQY
jgi:hypothetical protein